MKKLILVCMVWAMAGLAFSQKNESFSFDCGGTTYSFSGIRIGDAVEAGKDGKEYYYSNPDGLKAIVYQVTYYKAYNETEAKMTRIHKVVVPVTKSLSKMFFNASTGQWDIASYSDPKNYEEKCDCKTGKVEGKREAGFMPVFGFIMNTKQATEFQQIIDKINATVEAANK